MENLKITIEGFGATHSFEFPADVAAAFLSEVGIAIDHPQNALAEASEYMLRPVIQIGNDRIGRDRASQLTAAVMAASESAE